MRKNPPLTALLGIKKESSFTGSGGQRLSLSVWSLVFKMGFPMIINRGKCVYSKPRYLMWNACEHHVRVESDCGMELGVSLQEPVDVGHKLYFTYKGLDNASNWWLKCFAGCEQVCRNDATIWREDVERTHFSETWVMTLLMLICYHWATWTLRSFFLLTFFFFYWWLVYTRLYGKKQPSWKTPSAQRTLADLRGVELAISRQDQGDTETTWQLTTGIVWLHTGRS